MKRVLMISFIIAVSCGLMFPAGITVDLPSGGPNYYKGSTHNITWTKGGSCTGSSIKINIFKDSVNPANFVEQLTAGISATSKSWTIGMGYVTGTYIIRVKTDDNSCFGDSPAFSVTNAPGGSATITVNIPNASTDWCIDSTKTISWTTTGVSDGTALKINIFRNSINPANFVEQLNATNGTNSGSKSWTISAGTYTHGNYQIRIKTNDDSVTGDSAVFHLKDCSGGGGTLPPWLIDKLKHLKEVWWWRKPPHPPGPWPPGPNPCLSCPPVFDLSKIKELLSQKGLKGRFGVELYKDGVKFADLGKFGEAPKQPAKQMPRVVRMQKMQSMRFAKIMPLQNKLILKGLASTKSKGLEGGKGFRLVIKNSSGKIVFEDPIFLKQKMMKQIKEIKQIR